MPNYDDAVSFDPEHVRDLYRLHLGNASEHLADAGSAHPDGDASAFLKAARDQLAAVCQLRVAYRYLTGSEVEDGDGEVGLPTLESRGRILARFPGGQILPIGHLSLEDALSTAEEIIGDIDEGYRSILRRLR